MASDLRFPTLILFTLALALTACAEADAPAPEPLLRQAEKAACTAGGATCTIDAECFDEGALNPLNACEICDPTMSDAEWSPRSCDDGVVCTENMCDMTEGCQFPITAGDCLIDGVCYSDGEAEDGNNCQACDSSADASAWSQRPADTSCDDDNSCTFNDVCDGAGACQGTLLPGAGCGSTPTGSICASDGECVSGNCVDSICCDQGCQPGCMACRSDLTGVNDGVCAPVIEGRDPHDTCANQGASTCGRDGVCDGAGECRTYADDTVCASNSCLSNANGFLPEGVCQAGECVRGGPAVDCSPFVCDAGACSDTCARDRDCNEGAWCDRSAGACMDTNRPPTASAGENQNVNGLERVTLNALGSSDPDGDLLQFGWRQTSPSTPKVTLSSTASIAPTFRAPQVNGNTGAIDLVFEVDVSDGEATDTATTTVTVNIDVNNVAPVAFIAAPDSARQGEIVLLSGSNSFDGEGAILSYTWSQVGGEPVELSNTNAAAVQFRVPDQATGEIVISLIVHDGLVGSEEVQATILIIENEREDDCACSSVRRTPDASSSGQPLGLAALMLGAVLAWRRRKGPRS